MPFDLAPETQRASVGQTAYQDGLAAEDIILRDYLGRGYRLVAQRWRGRCGEIDLILRGDDGLIFVEVKKAKTLDIAATRLSQRQLWRIARSAEDYVGRVADDPFTPIRLDLAMVDGSGRTSVLENLSLY